MGAESPDSVQIKPIKSFITKYGIVLLLVFSFIIRMYYFFITKDQALWWDEAEYLNIAKKFSGEIPFYVVNVQRPLLFPILESMIYGAGLGEYAMRFVLLILPSLGIVVLTYLIGNEFYDKKTSLYGATFMSVFWLLLFVTNRLLTDVLAMFFSLAAVYLFWKGYVKKEKNWYVWLSGIFIILAFNTRLIGFITLFAILFFLIATEKLNFLKDKNIWITASLSAILLLPYLVWMKIKYGSWIASLQANTQGITEKFGWYTLQFFPLFTGKLFFIIFLIGLVLILYELLIAFDLVSKEKQLKAHILNLALIFVYYVYFIFILRAPPGIDPRWLIPTAVPMALIIGKSLTKIESFVSKYNKIVAILAVIIILAYGSFDQLRQADNSINDKKLSYAQERQAGMWLKENTRPGDIIVAQNDHAVFVAYTGREVRGIESPEENGLIGFFKKTKPKYLLLSAYPPIIHQWVYEFPQKYKGSLFPVQAFFEGQQPIIIIYEFKNYAFD